jgi:hypothetical protein
MSALERGMATPRGVNNPNQYPASVQKKHILDQFHYNHVMEEEDDMVVYLEMRDVEAVSVSVKSFI